MAIKKKRLGGSSGGSSTKSKFKLRNSNKRRNLKKKQRRIQGDSGSDTSSGSSGGGSHDSDSGRRKRKKDASTDKVALGKIKSTLTVGKTERNALRNKSRDISYAYTVNTSRSARKDDAGVSIKSTIYKQGGEKKLQIRKLDFDNPSKLKDTISAIVDMDQVGGNKSEPLKRIEIDLDGVKDIGKLREALKELDPSIKVDFKYKDRDRNRPFELGDGYGSVQRFIEAAKGRPNKNENLAAMENLLSAAQNIQSKDSPTKADMDQIDYLNQQMEGFLKRAESELKSEEEINFLNGVKMALALEGNRLTEQKAEIEARDALPPPKSKDLLVAAKEIRLSKEIQETLSINKIERNRLRNANQILDYAFQIDTSKDAQNNDLGIHLKSTLFKKEGEKRLRIDEIDFDDPTQFKQTLNAILNMDQSIENRKEALSGIEIELAGVSDLGKLRTALKDLDSSIKIEFKFKDREKNRPYEIEKGLEGLQKFMEAAKGRPQNNETIDAIENLVNKALEIDVSDLDEKDKVEQLLYINQQINGFMNTAKKEASDDNELWFLENVNLLLGIEKDKWDSL